MAVLSLSLPIIPNQNLRREDRQQTPSDGDDERPLCEIATVRYLSRLQRKPQPPERNRSSGCDNSANNCKTPTDPPMKPKCQTANDACAVPCHQHYRNRRQNIIREHAWSPATCLPPSHSSQAEPASGCASWSNSESPMKYKPLSAPLSCINVSIISPSSPKPDGATHPITNRI